MTSNKQRQRVRLADPRIDDGEQAAVSAVLESGQLAAGQEVEAFEAEFAAYCDSEHGIATSNGTTALHTALEAVGIGDGDTVITTPFTFIATANAIRFAGGEPIFADIDPETYNLDPVAVEETIRAHDGAVNAILAVHLYGLPAELDALADIAERYDIPLIEDAAQAHGARYRGQPVGAIGDVGCFSFYPTKNMTTGEGGMVVTESDEIAAQARQFIDHGRTEGYEHARLGHNFRMTDIAAAIGRVQLNRLPDDIERRRENASHLRDGLADSSLGLPDEPDGMRHAYHQFTVRSEQRDALRDHLDDCGIDTGVYYPIPVHEQPAYASVTASTPVAERASSEVLSLPVHPKLSANERERICTAVETFDR